MALNLQLILPIVAPLRPFPEQRQSHDDTLAELAGLADGLKPFDKFFGEASIGLRIVREPQSEPMLRELWSVPNKFREYSFLFVEIDGLAKAEHTYKDIADTENLSSEGGENLSRQSALDDFLFEANLIFLAANIARPGSVSADAGYSFIDGLQIGTTEPFFAEDFYSAVTAAKEFNWPKLLDLNFHQAWIWLPQSGAITDGMGVGRAGRAIAALSHVTTSSQNRTSSIDLFWILLGLEALYCKGTNHLQKQLLEKTEIILGPRGTEKRGFQDIYDFRSRLIHGDKDIPLRFTEFDAVEKYEQFHDSLYKNEDLAFATLVATLQRMAANNLKQLKFD